MTFVPCFAPVRHRSARGTFDADNPAPGILVATVTGHGDDDVANSLAVCIDRMVATWGTYEAFHDWSGMTGYSSSARVRLTELARTRKVRRINLLFENRLIAMGVSVASIMAPALAAFSDRRVFEAARDAAIAEAWRQASTADRRPAR